MLQMSEKTRFFLASNCRDIPKDREHLNELLDYLDDLMTASLDEEYNPTEKTRSIVSAYDDLYAHND